MAAGPELVHACRLLGGCKTGQPKATKGFRLPAKFVVHTVGPVWRGGQEGEPSLLASCYKESLRVAVSVGAQSVAFPSISTGIFGYPVARASRVAVASVREALEVSPGIQEVVFCCFSAEDLATYEQALGEGVA